MSFLFARPVPLASAAATMTERRRWLCLTVVVAAQFMFVVDAFIVAIAVPSIRADLGMTEGGIEAVIALYQIAFATLVIAGGRLGDLHGRRAVFLCGLLGFTAASVWCGLARSGAELIAARLLQGATAALMSPQVLATIHTLFPDAARARAFAVFGVSLGLGAAVGVAVGGWLVTLDLYGTGWRMIFFVNAPIGLAIAAAAARVLPALPGRREQRLDLPGAALLFVGLLGLITPVLSGRVLGWPSWLAAVAAGGAGALALFVAWERRVARAGGQPLIDLALLTDPVFARGLLAVLCFFAANMSFYFLLTLFLRTGLGLTPLAAGLSVVPISLAFIVGSRGGGDIVRGCWIEIAGLLGAGAAVLAWPAAGVWVLLPPLLVFGYGQGRVLAPLFGVVLAGVRHAHAGAGSGILTTTQQTGNAAGVAVLGLVYFAIGATFPPRVAFAAALGVLCLLIVGAALALRWMASAARDPEPTPGNSRLR